MMGKPIIISIVLISVLFSTSVQAGADEKKKQADGSIRNSVITKKNQKEVQNISQEAYSHSDPAKLLCKLFSSKTPLTTLKNMMPNNHTQIYKGEGCRLRYSRCYITVSETKSQKITVRYRYSFNTIRLRLVNLESKELTKPYFHTSTEAKEWLSSLGFSVIVDLKGKIWGSISQRIIYYDEIKNTEELGVWPTIDVKMPRDHQGVYRTINIKLFPYDYDKGYQIIPEIFCRESLIPLYNKLKSKTDSKSNK